MKTDIELLQTKKDVSPASSPRTGYPKTLYLLTLTAVIGLVTT